MGYIMSQDRNPYYDSARSKPDRSEFASLRMDVQPTRRPPSRSGWLNVVLVIGVLIVIAIAAKRFLLT